MNNSSLPNLEGHNKHKRNCTVLALAYSANISYQDAFQTAKQAGREDNKGFQSKKLIAYANKTFTQGRFYKTKRSPITVQKFCKKYPSGRYYVRKRGHAYSIVDGVVYDKQQPKPRERILEAWLFVSKHVENKQNIN